MADSHVAYSYSVTIVVVVLVPYLFVLLLCVCLIGEICMFGSDVSFSVCVKCPCRECVGVSICCESCM